MIGPFTQLVITERESYVEIRSGGGTMFKCCYGDEIGGWLVINENTNFSKWVRSRDGAIQLALCKLDLIEHPHYNVINDYEIQNILHNNDE